MVMGFQSVLSPKWNRPQFAAGNTGGHNNTNVKQRELDFIEAAKKGFLDVFIDLLTETDPAKQIDINAGNGIKNTALMMASGNGHPGIVEGLLQYGADPNLANRFGKTALIFAALNGQAECVEYLLKAGADKTLKDEDGKTALDLAREYQFEERSNPERYTKVIALLE